MQNSQTFIKRAVESGVKCRELAQQFFVIDRIDCDFNPIWIYCPDCGMIKIDETNTCPRCGSTSNGCIL